MPKIIARVLDTKIDEQGWMIGKLRFNEKLPPKNELVSVKWGSTRTMPQNALYWVYLNWCINEGNLKEHGHFSTQALHQDLKTHFLSEKIMHKGQFISIEEPSTTTLDKSGFSAYMEKVDSFMLNFFALDTSPFWETHRKDYAL